MADSSKDIQLCELEDMISDLKQMVKTFQVPMLQVNGKHPLPMKEIS